MNEPEFTIKIRNTPDGGTEIQLPDDDNWTKAQPTNPLWTAWSPDGRTFYEGSPPATPA